MMTNNERFELLKELSLAFGPTGCEMPTAELIIEKLNALGYSHKLDRLGNVIVHVPSGKKDAKKLMISAHMDEVGFIVNDITDDGYIKFAPLGGFDPRVLCGKHVVFEGKDGGYVRGVIASKAIHHQSPEERTNATPIDKMYVDIGAKDKADAESLTFMAASGTFDSDFFIYGENGGFIKGKALDDRLGCAEMLYALEELKGESVPVDLYFCFTVREEIGFSGARTVAQTIAPDFAVVLETTAVADLPDVPESRRVATLGNGGAISLMDRSTIYDRGFVRFAMVLAEKKGIPLQHKRYVSGGNDAGSIHKAGAGVRTLAMSSPSRYIHSAACVVSSDDYLSMGDMLVALIKEFNSEEIENA